MDSLLCVLDVRRRMQSGRLCRVPFVSIVSFAIRSFSGNGYVLCVCIEPKGHWRIRRRERKREKERKIERERGSERKKKEKKREKGEKRERKAEGRNEEKTSRKPYGLKIKSPSKLMDCYDVDWSRSCSGEYNMLLWNGFVKVVKGLLWWRVGGKNRKQSKTKTTNCWIEQQLKTQENRCFEITCSHKCSQLSSELTLLLIVLRWNFMVETFYSNSG